MKRPTVARALLAYFAVVSFGAALDACAAGGDQDYDAGYTPAPTTKAKTSAPDATTSAPSSGDDNSSQGDDTNPPPGDDEFYGDDEAGDAGDGEAQAPGTLPCAAGEMCVDQAPPGWTGYVQLRLAVGDAGPGACAAPYATVQQAGVADPTGAPAQCAPCTCGAPSPAVTCTLSVSSANILCLGSDTVNQVGSQCQSVMLPNGGTGAAPSASGSSSCAPRGGQVAGTPDAAASTPAIVCAPGADDAGADGGAAPTDTPPTCDPTQACAAAIASPAGPSGVCIYQAGVTTCPAGSSFSEQHVVGASVADTRGCGCSCGAAACPTDGYIAGFTNDNCTGTPAVKLDAGAACGTALKNATHFSYVESASSSPGSCPVEDAGPTGGVSVDGASALTLCCVP